MKKNTPLDQLQIEKKRWKKEIVERENRIAGHMHDLEKNFMSMAVYSFIPLQKEQKDKLASVFSQINHAIGSILPIKISDEKKSRYEGVLKMAQMAAAGLALRYFKNIVK